MNKYFLIVIITLIGLGLWWQSRPGDELGAIPTESDIAENIGLEEGFDLAGPGNVLPQAPQNIRLQPQSEGIDVAWQADANANHYGVWLRGPIPQTQAAEQQPVPEQQWAGLTKPTLQIEHLLNGALYEIRVANNHAEYGPVTSGWFLVSPIYEFHDGGNGQLNTTGARSDGPASFDFVKIDPQGRPTEAEDWTCVRDNTTGLMWERKQGGNYTAGDEGLFDADDRFSWFEPSSKSNQDVIGAQDSHGPVCAGYQAGVPATYCNTSAYVERVNQAALCGFQDWRLPTVDELMGLVDYGRVFPAINTDYFPSTRYGRFYWTASPAAECSYSAWYVYFLHGCSELGYYDSAMSVRLVRNATP